MRQSKIAFYMIMLCSLVLCAKFFLIWRININWDEFFYLSHVYTNARGEATRVFQQAYVHAFGWLPAVGENEIDQIVAARIVMWTLLTLTVCLMARLAREWTSPAIAWFAPLAFLTVTPVLRHAASFRADSLLAPLTLLALAAISVEKLTRNRVLIAGFLFGLSLAVSLKAVLILPLLLAMMVRPHAGGANGILFSPRELMIRAVQFGAIGAVTASLVLVMRWLALQETDANAIQGFAAGAARKMLIDAPFFPRWDYFSQSVENDWLVWLLILFGWVAALSQRSRAALLILSILPVLFYRNAFPYYYVVMLAPASVLAAIGIDALVRWSRVAVLKAGSVARLGWVPIAVSVPFIVQISLQLLDLGVDRQVEQRRTIEAVHQIFHEPVPYIDHSGMISSFPKANFFMSSWGIERYRELGTGFMAPLIAQQRPPLLVANHAALFSRPGSGDLLLPEDRHLIASSYISYWGIIMVAGAMAELPPADQAIVELPFPGRYRVETDGPISIDGVTSRNGDVVEIGDDTEDLSLILQNSSAESLRVRLVWSEANPERPEGIPPFPPIYSPL